jgi:hypothetical protein
VEELVGLYVRGKEEEEEEALKEPALAAGPTDEGVDS